MLQRVNAGNKSLADYRSIIRPGLYEEVTNLAKRLDGARVLHVSATSFGGGVAEILYTLVPLMRDVGLEAEWDIMFGSEPFFNVTKGFHNALQGADYDLTVEGRAIYEEYNRQSAAALAESSRGVGRGPRPRSAARPDPALLGRTLAGHELGLALPHRHLDAEPAGARLPVAVHNQVRRPDLHDGAVHPAGGEPAGADTHPAGHRPALAEEHGPVLRRLPAT